MMGHSLWLIKLISNKSDCFFIISKFAFSFCFLLLLAVWAALAYFITFFNHSWQFILFICVLWAGTWHMEWNGRTGVGWGLLLLIL